MRYESRVVERDIEVGEKGTVPVLWHSYAVVVARLDIVAMLVLKEPAVEMNTMEQT